MIGKLWMKSHYRISYSLVGKRNFSRLLLPQFPYEGKAGYCRALPKIDKDADDEKRILPSKYSVIPCDIDVMDNAYWDENIIPISHLPKLYQSLSKKNLSMLVTTTAVFGYFLSPGTFNTSTLMYLAAGTLLTAAAANCFNQVIEFPYDSQMQRTRNRVVAKGVLSSFHALNFGIVSLVLGATTLFIGTNAVTGSLAVINVFIYSVLYTLSKRFHIMNTYVGSVVGAIPPIMGWAASTGGNLSAGAFALGALMYCWQFPHFNALSWRLRSDYTKAGYTMMCVTHPNLCKSTALLHSVLLLPLCSFVIPYTGLTTWTFAADSLPFNIYLCYLSARFYCKADSESSQRLFLYTLLHLPIVLLLSLISRAELLS